MVEYSISVEEYGHHLVPEVVVQAYHCEYLHVGDLVVVVLVVPRSSDFDQLILVISHIIILLRISSRSHRSINSSTNSLAKCKRDTARSVEGFSVMCR